MVHFFRWQKFTSFFSRARMDVARYEKRDFFYKHNTSRVKELMTSINERDVKCVCKACLNSGRWTDDVSVSGNSSAPCMFAPYWENLLKMYQLSFVREPVSEEYLDDADVLKGIVRIEANAALVGVSLVLFCVFFELT